MSIGKEMANKNIFLEKEQTYFQSSFLFEIEKEGMGNIFSATTIIIYKSPTVSMNNDLFLSRTFLSYNIFFSFYIWQARTMA